MTAPTREQSTVLDCDARLRVVRASPGSGKTWLVAELIRRKLERWPSSATGVAALSFTRVGGDEIQRAMGAELQHPHFVGTLDAFMFRYVLRPFLLHAYPMRSAPRLLPADLAPELWTKSGDTSTKTVRSQINVHACNWIGETAGRATAAIYDRKTHRLRQLTNPELEGVKKRKTDIWNRAGHYTHSDVALWASKLLEHNELGAAIRREIVRRFPLIIVDELQDTGHFLGKCIRLLLEDPHSSGVLVGDPDQAIYEPVSKPLKA